MLWERDLELAILIHLGKAGGIGAFEADAGSDDLSSGSGGGVGIPEAAPLSEDADGPSPPKNIM